MRILAIETSGATFSIALAQDQQLVSEIFWHSGLTHSERLVPALNRLMQEAGWEFSSLGSIAVSIGPGSFTGIRVGLTCARTMAQVLGIPLLGLDTLEVLALAVSPTDYTVVPIIDALRNEVYVRKNGEVVIQSIDALLKGCKKGKSKLLFIGNGVLVYGKEIEKHLKKKAVPGPVHLCYPRAGILALAAGSMKGKKFHQIKPLYIRRSWAEENKKKDTKGK